MSTKKAPELVTQEFFEDAFKKDNLKVLEEKHGYITIQEYGRRSVPNAKGI